MNVTLFEKRLFEDVIKDLEIKSLRIIRVCPESNDKCPYKRHSKNRYTEEKGDMKMEAEIGVVWPQPRKEILTATRNWQGREVFSRSS